MRLKKLMGLLLAVFAFVAAALPASAQAIALSFSGSGTSPNNSNAITGTGTGTIAGGAGTVAFTGLTGNGGNCDSSIQFSLKMTAANGTDSLTTFYQATGGSGGDSGGAIAIAGTLTVTGATGIYAGKGGSGPATLNVNITKGSTTSTFTYTFTGSVTPGGTIAPFATVNPTGVVPVNSDLPLVQSGSWVSIYGTNMASGSTTFNGNFPTASGSTSVTFDGKAGFLWYVSSGQINVQVPDDSKTGCVPVVVNTPNGQVTTTVDLEPVAPSLNVLPVGANGKIYAAAIILTPSGSGAYGNGTYDIMGPTGNFSFPTRPAKKGEVVELFGVGLGPVKNPTPAGLSVSAASATTNQVQVFTNVTQTSGTQIPVSFAGLVAQGLYQINVTIPQNATTGDQPMQVLVGTGSTATQITSDLTIYLSLQ